MAPPLARRVHKVRLVINDNEFIEIGRSVVGPKDRARPDGHRMVQARGAKGWGRWAGRQAGVQEVSGGRERDFQLSRAVPKKH